MIQFFTNIFYWLKYNVIDVVIQLVKSFYQGMIQILKLLPQMQEISLGALKWLPSVLVAFITISISIYIIYRIIGRDT